MVLTLTISPEIETAMIDYAKTSGLEPEEIVLNTLREKFISGTTPISNTPLPSGDSLFDALGDYVGAIRSSATTSDASEHIGNVLTEILIDKKRQKHL